MESSNPTLNNKVFANAEVVGGAPTMTIQGTVNKSLILLALLVFSAFGTWSMASVMAPSAVMILLIASGIGGFILALVTTFKPDWAHITSPLYAVLEGVVLALLSAFFEMRYPGIVMQAVGLTFAVMMVMLLGYKAGWFAATPGLRKGMMIAMGGLMLFYAVVFIAGFFGVKQPGFINGGGPLGIAFSLFIVGLASMSLILDFDFIEQAAKNNVAKRMEWYGAFTLMVTLIWLYMEILRLLSKLQSRD